MSSFFRKLAGKASNLSKPSAADSDNDSEPADNHNSDNETQETNKKPSLANATKKLSIVNKAPEQTGKRIVKTKADSDDDNKSDNSHAENNKKPAKKSIPAKSTKKILTKHSESEDSNSDSGSDSDSSTERRAATKNKRKSSDNDSGDDNETKVIILPKDILSHANAKVLAEDEIDDSPSDTDDWRRKNRLTKLQKGEQFSREAKLEWLRFRLNNSIPVKTIVSAGANNVIRKALLNHKELIEFGFPINIRRCLWEMLSGSRTYPERLEHLSRYEYYLDLIPSVIPSVAKDIQRDVPRAIRGHAKFLVKSGQKELIHILSSLSLHSPGIGYCNSMLHVAGFLLLHFNEERAFWMLCALVDNVLPADYFTNSLLGVRADTQLIKILVFQRMPKLHAHLTQHNIDVYVYCLRWLMSLFIVTLPLPTINRIFDIMMFQGSNNSKSGSNILIQIALALLILNRPRLMQLEAEELLIFMEKIGEDRNVDTELLIKTAIGAKCKLLREDFDRRDAERKIMEIDYMRELQTNLKYKRIEEERRKKEQDEEKQKRLQQIDALQYGTEMWKIGAEGKAKKIKIYLTREGKHPETSKWQYTVSWDSKKKSKLQSSMKLRDCALFFGLKHGQFIKRPEFAKQFANNSHQAFTLVNYERSLDLVACSSVDYDQWIDAIKQTDIKEIEKLDLKAAKVQAKEKEKLAEEKTSKAKKNQSSSPQKGAKDNNDSEKENGAEVKKAAPVTNGKKKGSAAPAPAPAPAAGNTVRRGSVDSVSGKSESIDSDSLELTPSDSDSDKKPRKKR